MLDALIVILREALEASLIISVLLAASYFLRVSRQWMLWGLIAGLGGAAIVAYFLDLISGWFDGAGQELLNALLLAWVCLSLMTICHLVARYSASAMQRNPQTIRRLLCCALVGASGLAIVREGCEILIYMYGFAGSLETFIPVLIGGGIGLGIGGSVGVLIYYFTIKLPRREMMLTVLVIMALIGAGMVLQAVQYLEQTGMLPMQAPLWNASGWISEVSLTGQLLYALIGYEATPTPLQIIFYLLTLGMTGFLAWLGAREHADGNLVSDSLR
jgi:high-affinity iron transporter